MKSPQYTSAKQPFPSCCTETWVHSDEIFKKKKKHQCFGEAKQHVVLKSHPLSFIITLSVCAAKACCSLTQCSNSQDWHLQEVFKLRRTDWRVQPKVIVWKPCQYIPLLYKKWTEDKHNERNRGLTGQKVIWMSVEWGILVISFDSQRHRSISNRYSNTFTPVMSVSWVVSPPLVFSVSWKAASSLSTRRTGDTG